MREPETKYAKSGDVNVAYQVVGDGPIDLVYVPGIISHLDVFWEEPAYARSLERLASFSRLILFDKRGQGLSDRLPPTQLPTLEERMDDVRAVMDAAGSERAALFGWSEGGSLAAFFAATYPQRTTALLLYGAPARFVEDDDYPQGIPWDVAEVFVASMKESWGTAALLHLFAPNAVGDERFEAWWGRYARQAASPAAAEAIMRMALDTDVRHILGAIRVPTLVLHRDEDGLIPIEHARFIAERIPGARLVELPGEDHLWFVGDTDTILDEIEEFVTGARAPRDPDRILATVVFTDIVASTERAAQLGDRRWRELLEDHNRCVRRELDRFQGREVKTTGDGLFAAFDGPARAIRCACAIRDATRRLGLDIRAGIHTGECEVMNGDLGGIAVHIGARVLAEAGPGEVLASRTVTDLVAGSGIDFSERGARVLKGVPGEWQLFAVADD